jgi:hypothetical protein
VFRQSGLRSPPLLDVRCGLNRYPCMGQSTPKRGEPGLGARKRVEEPRRLSSSKLQRKDPTYQLKDRLIPRF